MITYIYRRELPVLPFLVAPIAFINDEAAVVLGPQELAAVKGKLLREVYTRIETTKLTNPLIAQLSYFNHRVLVINTIQTTVLDPQSGRLGLRLTYGALVEKNHFQGQRICTRIFDLFQEYFYAAFHASGDLEGMASVVGHFQKVDVQDNLIDVRKADSLLERFAEEFPPPLRTTLFSRVASAIKARQKDIEFFQPLSNMHQAERFWKHIDDRLTFGVSESSQAPYSGAEATTIWPGADQNYSVGREAAMSTKMEMTDSFKAYEEGKHRRYQLLFSVNGGAFAVAKLLVGKDASSVLGSLTLRQLAIGMILFTIVLGIDIFFFGRKMREEYLPNAFAWPGKLVLILIVSIVSVGWWLVAW